MRLGSLLGRAYITPRFFQKYRVLIVALVKFCLHGLHCPLDLAMDCPYSGDDVTCSNPHRAANSLRADVSKYRPEVYKSEKSKTLKKIHKVALGKLLT